MSTALRAGILVAAALASAVSPVRANPEGFCAKVRNDDRVRPYEPALRQGFVRAFRSLFPDAKGSPSDAMLRAEGVFRCMDGRPLACFVGANLPCAKIDRSRVNRGASAFCRDNPDADFVPLVAAGHDSEFNWLCRDGHAETAGTALKLDSRGFAAKLWAPMDSD